MLFLGGFILSKAMEKSNTHRKIALWIVRAVGGCGAGPWGSYAVLSELDFNEPCR